MVTYKTNANTSEVIKNMIRHTKSDATPEGSLRIVLESDAPYMVPTNIYGSLNLPASKSSPPRLALCHSGMLPWVAEFIADVANSALDDPVWNAERVMKVCQSNAEFIYGIRDGSSQVESS